MGDSIYDRLIAVYRRSPQGSLIRCFGRHEQSVQSKWAEIQGQLHPRSFDSYWFLPSISLHGTSWPCGVANIQGQLHPHSFDSYRFLPNISLHGTSWPSDVANDQGQLHPHSFDLYRFLPNITLPGDSSPCDGANIHEAASPDSGPIIGLILRPASNENDMSAFDEYFARIILPHIAQVSKLWELPESVSNCSVAERVVDLCDAEILVHPPNSQWHQLGRDYLTQRISFFTKRGLPIQMCLPAFPCKSSNPEKVSGALPDRGEELALRRLYAVLRKVEGVYPPGANLCIISDGHVFSDCIGVDDDQVDRYGQCLQELNETIGAQEGQDGQITFQSLKDIFHSTPECILGVEKALQMRLPSVNHFLDTNLDPDTEFSRQAMTLACQPDRTSLRKFITNQESSTLSLYRGFSRFMLDDLALHPRSVSASRSQRKKCAEKIAFEMLLRNQAYSNLVELFFPDHIRLSIHAHINSGPKFAVNLFDRTKTRVVDSLDNLSRIAGPSHDLLHIPTPWHNCVFQLSQNDMIFVAKTKVIQEALESNRFKARWIHPDTASASGGFFEVEICENKSTEQGATMSASTPSIDLLGGLSGAGLCESKSAEQGAATTDLTPVADSSEDFSEIEFCKNRDSEHGAAMTDSTLAIDPSGDSSGVESCENRSTKQGAEITGSTSSIKDASGGSFGVEFCEGKSAGQGATTTDPAPSMNPSGAFLEAELYENRHREQGATISDSTAVIDPCEGSYETGTCENRSTKQDAATSNSTTSTEPSGCFSEVEFCESKSAEQAPATDSTSATDPSTVEEVTTTTNVVDTARKQGPHKHRRLELPRLKKILRYCKIRKCL